MPFAENFFLCQDTNQWNNKGQRSYVTYGQRPSRIHFEESDGYDLITSLHQIKLQFGQNRNPAVSQGSFKLKRMKVRSEKLHRS